MMLTANRQRPWLALLGSVVLAACTVPGDNDKNPPQAPVIKAEEGALACPTDGSSALTFSGTAGTAVVEGIGPGETRAEHQFELPAGCTIESLTVRVEWDLQVEDLDIALLFDGVEVGSSGSFNAVDGAFEEIVLGGPQPGVYTLVVNSYSNVDTDYMASAQLLGAAECQPGDGKAEVQAELAQRLEQAGDNDLFEVIIAFHGSRGVTSTQAAWMNELGLSGTYFRHLPLAGALASKQQIEVLAADPQVRSIWPNYERQLEDVEARYLSSNDQAEANPALVNSDGQPITGKGVSILVNDSGIDATHPDLQFGSKVVENALGHTNLRAQSGMLPFTPTEGVPHSDIFGSHGTHVAGIAAGDGSASGGKYRGAAPGASLVGYGAGASLLILDDVGGFDYALHILDTKPELNLRIITNSFGTTSDQGSRFNPNDPTNIATKELADRDMIVVFSAGNQGSGPDSITGNYKKAPWVSIAAAGNKDGMLGGYSSRGALSGGTYESQIGCETFTVHDRPTVVTTGSDYISARAYSADAVGAANWSADATSEDVEPALKPFYTQNTGTSMAAPHLAGIIALILEANPALSWREVKHILETTASNMPGYEPWEVGAGHANVEAALSMALGLRNDFGSINHTLNPANSRIELGGSSSETYEVNFQPVGGNETVEFEVPEGVALVIASWPQPLGSGCTCAVVITDPAGNRYGSGIALPLLAPRVSAVGPGMAGTWTLEVSGFRSVSENNLDPAAVTNGYGLPETLDVTVQQIEAGARTGLDDVDGHPLASFLEAAVVERLIDGKGNVVQPDAALTRGDFALYLTAWGVRQTRDLSGAGAAYADIRDAALVAAVEGVTGTGKLLLDPSTESAALMPTTPGSFLPSGAVSRQDVAYALTQASGRAVFAANHSGELRAFNSSMEEVPVVDADTVNPAYRGHVQDAILRGFLKVRFNSDETEAYVEANASVSRAEFARMAVEAHALLPHDL